MVNGHASEPANSDCIRDCISDCIEGPISQLVALFRGELAEVTFPGVSAATLDEAVAAVATQADEVEVLRAAMREAMESLEARQRDLREHARQAHAYARVFAAPDPELTAQLDAIAFDEPPAQAPKKRRGRRPKATAAPQLALD